MSVSMTFLTEPYNIQAILFGVALVVMCIWLACLPAFRAMGGPGEFAAPRRGLGGISGINSFLMNLPLFGDRLSPGQGGLLGILIPPLLASIVPLLFILGVILAVLCFEFFSILFPILFAVFDHFLPPQEIVYAEILLHALLVTHAVLNVAFLLAGSLLFWGKFAHGRTEPNAALAVRQ